MSRPGKEEAELIEERRDLVRNFLAMRASPAEITRNVNRAFTEKYKRKFNFDRNTIVNDIKAITEDHQRGFEKNLKQWVKDGRKLIGLFLRNSEVRIKKLMAIGTPSAIKAVREEELSTINLLQEFGLIPKNLGDLNVHNTHELLAEAQERFKHADSQEAEGEPE